MSTQLQNVNDIVEFKLTDAGMRAYRESWKTYYGSLEFDEPGLNENGMHEFQLWYLMMHLGPHCRMGGPQLFENNTIRVRQQLRRTVLAGPASIPKPKPADCFDQAKRFYRPVHGGYPTTQHHDLADRIAAKCREIDEVIGPDAWPIAGWTKWNGGNCPVNPFDVVCVQFRDGSRREDEAGEFDIQYCWKHFGTKRDIVAYRVISAIELKQRELIDSVSQIKDAIDSLVDEIGKPLLP